MTPIFTLCDPASCLNGEPLDDLGAGQPILLNRALGLR
ncbi:hypothetical protein CCACVL1_06105 [Corchorus capsularis]|uniref:Uncharacterized protein n=1 Tax=Corchorus capsularis TaxID=210143 RepID=A0A1R3JHB9_COCAP|nr:hypothetical protein CCACVL1_06105 [Corchorus capsularis]